MRGHRSSAVRWPLVVGLGLAASTAPARIIDRVVAVVNDEVIVLSELEDLVRPTLQKLSDIADPVVREQQRDKFLRRGLDELVGQRLVLQQAVTLKVNVRGPEVDEHIDRIKAQRGWDDEQLRMYLTAQGLRKSAFRAQVREQLLRNKVVRRKLVGGVQVSETDVEQYYKDELTKANTNVEVDAAHIVLSVDPGASAAQDAAVAQEAREIMARAQAGEDFAALARQYSRGPGKDAGGRLGTVRRGSVSAELEEALFALGEGEVGGPVRTRYGYHVVKALARKKLAPPALSEVEGRLRAELQNKKLQDALAKWVEELKEKAFIEIRL